MYRQLKAAYEKDEQPVLVTEIRKEKGRLGEDLSRRILSVSDLQTASHVAELRAGIQTLYTPARELPYQVFEPYRACDRLIILGGGHVALATAKIASMVDFSISVCDDRPEFSSRERFPFASKCFCMTYSEALEQLTVNSRDYILILTRQHQFDRECLQRILSGTEPYYCGMLGSRRRVAQLFDGLEAEGYSRERINRICSPVGLAIGGRTPEEIAVSIVGEMISYRRQRQPQTAWSTDLQPELAALLAEDDKAKAIVTVIEAKGSCPRKAGAKMIVREDGSILGSVGGGSTEGMLIRRARSLIGTGCYEIVSEDMTEDATRSDDLVCGGTMTFLIEDCI